MLSPHLDDAAFSVGAFIRQQTRLGVQVTAVTVFANDPAEGDAPPGAWDRRCGFESLSAAARARRREDLRATELLGGTPIWLPFPDETYRRRTDPDELWAAIVWAIGKAEAVLVPGFPLSHQDHRLLARLVLKRRDQLSPAIGFFAEQPYASGRVLTANGRGSSDRQSVGAAARFAARLASASPPIPPSVTIDGQQIDGLEWHHLSTSRKDRRAKLRAVAAYRSQLRALGAKPLVGSWLYEVVHGGEAVAWLGD